MEKVSDERRNGDKNKDYAIIAEMWKLVGNSAFGRTGMNRTKFTSIRYGDEETYFKMVGKRTFRDANQYGKIFEVSYVKRRIYQNMPIQIAMSIYDDAKFKMSEFYYDCVDKYLDRSDFQYIEMDTDSAYMALTDDFTKLIKPEMKEEFENDKNKWFLRNDTPEIAQYDKRTPGLFKPEFVGSGIVALSSKMYYVKGFYSKDKFSCKGVQKKHNIDTIQYEVYKNVLFGETHKILVTNKGLRVFNDRQVYHSDSVYNETNQNRKIYMYETTKIGLTQKYDKRITLSDKVSTVPLKI